MKKTYIILPAVLLMISAGLWCQTPKEIVKKSVHALGGETIIKKHMDYSAEGERKVFYNTMAVTYAFKEIKKIPKEYRRYDTLEGNPMSFIHVFDGQDAWIEYSGTVSSKTSLNYKTEQAHTITLLLEKGASFSPAKETEIDGKKAIGIDVDFKGKKTSFFFDADTYLPVEIVYKDILLSNMQVKEIMETRARYMEYKTFDGVLFPSRTIIYKKGKKITDTRFNNVVFNSNVSPDTFIRPEQELDLRTREELLH